MHHQSARKTHALAHAAGEFLGIGDFKAIETDEVDGRQRALRALVGSDARASSPSSTFS